MKLEPFLCRASTRQHLDVSLFVPTVGESEKVTEHSEKTADER